MSSESTRAQHASILVVDDDDALREILCMHLREQGYQVNEAADGEVALELARALIPRLIVLDITMPKINGWEVARRLRAAKETAGIKILLLSGIGSDVLGPTLPVFGGDLALDKPFELNELNAAIERLLA